MAGAATTFGKDQYENVLRGTTVTPPANWFLALFTSDPGIAGSTAGEVSTSGTGYARKSIAASTGQWNAPVTAPNAGRLVDNINRQSIGTVTATWGTFTFWGLMDASSGGNMWFRGDINGGTGFTPSIGTEVAFEIGALDIILAEALNVAITTFAQHVDAKFNRSQVFVGQATAATIVPNVLGLYSLWQSLIFNGTTPTTGSGNTCTNATQGSVQSNMSFTAPGGGNTLYTDCCAAAATTAITAWISDRLVTTSGLDGTLTTSQAVNTVALPARATGGAGCLIALEAYAATGATSVTFTVTYTNSAGTGSRVATVTGTLNQLGKILIVPLQAGDVGVQSVQSVQQSATTGGAGNYGVTIYKPMTWINSGASPGSSSNNSVYDTSVAIVNSAACVWVYCQQHSATVISTLQIAVGFVDGLWTRLRLVCCRFVIRST